MKQCKSNFQIDQILATFRFIEKTSVTPIDKKTCEQKGGEWRRVGLAGRYQCIFTYSDGGKGCNSSDECQGLCVVYDAYEKAGTCKEDSDFFGCYATIEDFKAGRGIILCKD